MQSKALEHKDGKHTRRILSAVGLAAYFLGCTTTGPFTNRELIDELRKQELQVQEIPSGVAVILPHVLFAYKSADLVPDTRRHVDHIAAVLNHRRALSRQVSVEGHADAIGSDQYNFELSQKRAETVAQELVAYGVRRERVAIRSFGEQRPLAPNTKPDGTDNPEGRAQNRRVEVVILN